LPIVCGLELGLSLDLARFFANELAGELASEGLQMPPKARRPLGPEARRKSPESEEKAPGQHLDGCSRPPRSSPA